MRSVPTHLDILAKGGVGRIDVRYEVGDGLVSLLRVGVWLA